MNALSLSRVLSLLVLAVAGSIAGPLTHAQPNVTVDYRFYVVSPRDYAGLKEELDSKSPIRMGDNVAHGHTRVNLQWRPIMMANGSECAVTRIEADLGLRYTLPQLELAVPDEDLRSRFAESYRILHEHEIGHGELAIQAARELDRELTGLTMEGSCQELEQLAISVANGIYAKYKALELEYDRETDHGRQQHNQILETANQPS